MAGVLVYWVASPRLGADRALVKAAAPPAYQRNPRDLTFFCSPPVCFWTIGDRCFWSTNRRPPSAGPPPPPPAAARGLTRVVMKRMRRRVGVGRRSHGEFDERPMSVASTITTADVLWQDGTRQRGVPAASLLPFTTRNDHDFLPGQHVVRVRRGGGGDGTAATGPSAGVVRSLDCKEQTVRVAWLKPAAIHPGEPNDEFDYDEILSAYDLSSDDHSNAFYGNVVVRVHEDGDQHTQSDKDMGTTGDLSWVGHVTDLCEDGHVQVKWGNGNTSKVLPRQIAVVKLQSVGEMLREMGDWVHEDEDMDDNAVDNAQGNNSSSNGEGDDDHSDSGNDTEDGPVTVRAMGRVGAIVRAVIQRSRGVIAHFKKFIVSETTVENIEPPVPLTEGNGEGSVSNGSLQQESCPFQHFDVEQSAPDHHYLDSTEQGNIVAGRKWAKRVQKEWSILENSLPDTIYVRAYEDRMDLLRAVMVGAAGTPYHDGLFFFDLQLPSSYPAAPPLVNYRSFGLRVNPNLYPSGTVCLSLLDTFGGQGTELWSPEASSILQVVVSIQGLVLNAQPYYNEAGYGAQVGRPEGRRNELPYSENAYLLTLQTMLQLLRRPPVGFEDFVRSHFFRRGYHVLRACEAYLLEGCLVGTLDGEARVTEGSRAAQPCSAGFRLALTNMVPRLVDAFIAINADGCEEFDRLRVPALCTPSASTCAS